ncbi:hypothetical protein B0H10DRAFT_2346804, partial [Mycena sp. CBHHK59/15]
ASADVKGLPALVGPTWDTHYLPTAYRALYCSADPMMFAAMGDTPTSQTTAVNTVQAILDAVHPGHTLPNVVWGNKVCKKTVERIRERRSLIAQTGLKVVDETFKGEDYIHQPVAIRTYAKYAARFDGPGFWKEPTPESSPRDPKAPGYIKGSGYLESVMIIQTVAPFLKNEGFSLPDAGVDGTYDFSGMPRGLFALAAAGYLTVLTFLPGGTWFESLQSYRHSRTGPQVYPKRGGHSSGGVFQEHRPLHLYELVHHVRAVAPKICVWKYIEVVALSDIVALFGRFETRIAEIFAKIAWHPSSPSPEPAKALCRARLGLTKPGPGSARLAGLGRALHITT